MSEKEQKKGVPWVKVILAFIITFALGWFLNNSSTSYFETHTQVTQIIKVPVDKVVTSFSNLRLVAGSTWIKCVNPINSSLILSATGYLDSFQNVKLSEDDSNIYYGSQYINFYYISDLNNTVIGPGQTIFYDSQSHQSFTTEQICSGPIPIIRFDRISVFANQTIVNQTETCMLNIDFNDPARFNPNYISQQIRSCLK